MPGAGYFGELALLSHAPRAASCVASAKGAALLRLTRSDFDRALGPMVKVRTATTLDDEKQRPCLLHRLSIMV